ncbi:MAG TPA: tRNA isopentenyl-2-thiomethyl-A-37 hydroxylase MiaE [Anaeromyxobacteraceae bacterium]|nr:tRNA isopentenyl-2-thiomethyl-A-37 hydroxylase MiaE [Anaeromyxobacteraceae bacterium]
MTLLRSTTDPRWAPLALSQLGRTLCDHAHCEKKACATALKLIADYPDRPALVRALSKLAQEEQQHFLSVMTELSRRAIPLSPDRGDGYARALVKLVRPGKERLLDRLLVSAIIEARSAERLALLAVLLSPGSLKDLYTKLARSEEGHERLFLELASAHAGEEGMGSRLEELALAEAAIVAGLPIAPRIH